MGGIILPSGIVDDTPAAVTPDIAGRRTVERAAYIIERVMDEAYSDVHDLQFEISVIPMPNDHGQPVPAAILWISMGVPLDDNLRISTHVELPQLSIITREDNVRKILFEKVSELKAVYQQYLKGKT